MSTFFKYSLQNITSIWLTVEDSKQIIEDTVTIVWNQIPSIKLKTKYVLKLF
jgi:hypothetical protein